MIDLPSFSSSFARVNTASAPSPVNCEIRVAIFGIVGKSYHLHQEYRVHTTQEKRAQLSPRPSLNSSVSSSLERIPQRELNQPRHTLRARNQSKVPGTLHVRRHRVGKVCVVPDIEEI